jgi:hypothetical protein
MAKRRLRSAAWLVVFIALFLQGGGDSCRWRALSGHVAGPGAYRQSGFSDIPFLTFIDDCLHLLRSTSENARFWLAWRHFRASDLWRAGNDPAG